MNRSRNAFQWFAALLPAALLIGTWAAFESRAADAPPDIAKAAAAMYDGVRTETLPNGLRVYLLPVPNASTVTTIVAYRVGSCDEDKTFTGLAHYLEHLMFKGTEKIFPGDID